MRLTRGFFAVLTLAVTMLLAGGTGASADVDDFTFDELTVDYTLSRDDDGTSRLEVVERFVARFPDA
ncbi:MAG: DUF2207 domain-containing protein, partial [Microbacterium sp.]